MVCNIQPAAVLMTLALPIKPYLFIDFPINTTLLMTVYSFIHKEH